MARQLGLHEHPSYQASAEIFSSSCMPMDFEWALVEQRQMWLGLCLRRPIPSRGVAGGELPTHPFVECAAELCHSAHISPESEQHTAARTK